MIVSDKKSKSRILAKVRKGVNLDIIIGEEKCRIDKSRAETLQVIRNSLKKNSGGDRISVT